jgi:hypothetical protein
LDAGPIDRSCHAAAQGIDLADEVSLTDTAEGGVATHLTQGLDALREQQGATTDPGCGERGLGSGMAAADDDDIERVGVSHGCPF